MAEMSVPVISMPLRSQEMLESLRGTPGVVNEAKEWYQDCELIVKRTPWSLCVWINAWLFATSCVMLSSPFAFHGCFTGVFKASVRNFYKQPTQFSYQTILRPTLKCTCPRSTSTCSNRKVPVVFTSAVTLQPTAFTNNQSNSRINKCAARQLRCFSIPGPDWRFISQAFWNTKEHNFRIFVNIIKSDKTLLFTTH